MAIKIKSNDSALSVGTPSQLSEGDKIIVTWDFNSDKNLPGKVIFRHLTINDKDIDIDDQKQVDGDRTKRPNTHTQLINNLQDKKAGVTANFGTGSFDIKLVSDPADNDPNNIFQSISGAFLIVASSSQSSQCQ